jgi:hypothetical protein
MDITTLWKNEQCVIATGIYYADGAVTQMHINQINNTIAIDGRTDLNTLLKNYPDFLTSIDPYSVINFSIDTSNYAAYAGGGSDGNEGFVCLTQNTSVIWLAYFEESNPFMKMKFQNNCLHVVNNHREEWVFPIDFPEKISIERTQADLFLEKIKNKQKDVSHDEFYKRWGEGNEYQ